MGNNDESTNSETHQSTSSDSGPTIYTLMSHSLMVMWGNLRSLIFDRKELLEQSVLFYKAVDEVRVFSYVICFRRF